MAENIVKQSRNIASNVVIPFNSTNKLLGSSIIVSLEVVIHMFLTRFLNLGTNRRSVVNLISMHAISLSLLGGGGAWFGSARGQIDGQRFPPDEEDIPDSERFGSIFRDSMKGVPAVLLGDYVYKISRRGLYIGSFTFTDLLMIAVSKLLSRGLLGLSINGLQNAGFDTTVRSLDIINQVFFEQERISNLKFYDTEPQVPQQQQGQGQGESIEYV